MSTAGVGRGNRGRVLAALRERQPASRAELAAETGLSVATVARIAHTLTAAGLLVEETAVGDGGGRPLGRLRIDDNAAEVLAVDVADHHTTLAFLDLGHTVRWQRRLDVRPGLGADERLLHTLDAIREAWRSERRRRTVAIGVSIPGPVQADGTIDFAPSLHWHGVPLGSLLRGSLGVPVSVDNDANLIAVAEHAAGTRSGASSLVALAVFEGIGAGIIQSGTLWEGAHGVGGQIGRMLLGGDSIDRFYVDFGDLESQLGSVGLERRLHEAGIDLGIGLGGDVEVFAALFAHLDGEDPRLRGFAERVLDEFAAALANVCALLDPEAIVLAGRFAPLAARLVPELERRLTGRVLHVPALLATSTPVEGTLLGAAVRAFAAYGPIEQLLDES